MLDLFDSISFDFLRGQSSDPGFDDAVFTVCNPVTNQACEMMIRHLRSTCLQSYLIIFYCWTCIDWVSSECCRASWDLSRGAASSQAQTRHLLSYTYIISDLTKMLLCPTLLLLMLKPNQPDDRVIIPSLKLLLVMDTSSYIYCVLFLHTEEYMMKVDLSRAACVISS